MRTLTKILKIWVYSIVRFVLKDRLVQMMCDYVIKIPECNRVLSPIISVIPLQLLSYYVAKEKHLDVDKPRNLAKSVTVE